MKLNPEVHIYVQTIRNYFNSNLEVKNYFLKNIDEDFFYKKLSEIAQINFDKEGDATLTKMQFELLRSNFLSDADLIAEEQQDEFTYESSVLVPVPNFGFFSLN